MATERLIISRSDVISDLESTETYEQFDRSGMRHLIAGLPAQCRAAWTAGQQWPIPPSFRKPSRVILVGMGGSAIGGDVVATLAGLISPVPVQIVRGYTLPAMDADTLVVASSYSGDTEETLEAFGTALCTPGMRLAITSGGTLARMADSLGYPVLQYDFGGMPRAAIGWGIFSLLAILERLDVLQIGDAPVSAALNELARAGNEWAPSAPWTENRAKQIATAVEGRSPLIVGPDFFEVAARRWAAQINENAKQWAFYAALPEMNHNLIVAFGHPARMQEELHVLFLDSPLLHDRIRRRVDLTAQALDDVGIPHDELLIEGKQPLDALLRANYLGDWVSLYLAMINKTNATPVEPIERLKAALMRRD